MNRKELVSSVMDKLMLSGISKKKVADYVSAFLDTIHESIGLGEDVKLKGFGTFYILDRLEKEGRNFKTGEKVIIPAHKRVKFKVCNKLKEDIK